MMIKAHLYEGATLDVGSGLLSDLHDELKQETINFNLSATPNEDINSKKYFCHQTINSKVAQLIFLRSV